ncbi:MAG: sigma 54-interacting transcriptional regulator [Turneriella sp.]|nr:sigma 54-interacting transcriptional regulator [Turneriella sp.]
MNVYSTSIILAVFNLPLIVMGSLAVLRLDSARSRTLFVLLAGALMLWATPLVFVRADFLGAEIIAFMSRLTFCGGAIAVTVLFLFCDGFGGAKPSVLRYAALANGVFVLAATLAGFVEQGVVPAATGFMPVRGPMHIYYVISMSATVLAAFLRLALIYRHSDSTLLRFQIASIASYGLLGFAFPIINNGVFPILIPHYSFPVFGVLGVLFFQYGIFRMLVRGELLFIRRLFEAVKNSKAWQRHENIISLSRLTNMLNSIVVDNVTEFREAYPFTSAGGTDVKMHVQSDTNPGAYSSVALFNERVMPKWNRGILDNLVKLELDNKRLSLYLTKAENVIKEKWLTGALRSLTNKVSLTAATLPIDHYTAEFTAKIAETREVYGVEMLVVSGELFAVLEKLKRLAPGTGVVLIEGEEGTGKTLAASALHFYRTKAQVEVIECTRHSLNLRAELEALKKAGAGGAVLRNLHALTNEELGSLLTLLSGVHDSFRIYATAVSFDELWRRLPDEATGEAMRALPLVKIPPLRERPEDLRAQIFYFAAAANPKATIPWHGISASFLETARQYGWPGNSTELRNRIETVMLEHAGVPELAAEHLKTQHQKLLTSGLKLSPLEEAERQVIGDCLQRKRYNQRQTAIELQITINTLKAKMEKYGLQIPENH